MTFALVHDLFKLHGLDPEKGVEYINIPGSAPKVAALEKGLIAAALIAPPTDLMAVKAGFKRLVFLGDVMPDLPFTGLLATSRYIKDTPRSVYKMVKAITRAVYFTNDRPEVAIPVMQQYLQMTGDEAKDTYSLVRKSFSPVLTESSLQKVAEVVARSTGSKPTKAPCGIFRCDILKKGDGGGPKEIMTVVLSSEKKTEHGGKQCPTQMS